VSSITKQQLDVHHELLKDLGKVDRPSAVCTSGDMPLTIPGLKVDGLGVLSLPLGKTQARKLIEQCRHELEKRTAQAPQKPTDYRRADKLSCNCDDCSALSAFLANPDRKQGRFPLAKKRRQHLHQIIDGNLCDLTHVTERCGSPFTLVCTKTTASYEAACKIHKRDLQNLSRIIALENKTS